MSKYLFTLCVSLFLGVSSRGQTANSSYHIIPFTGTDYVRVVVDSAYRQQPSNTFKMIITSLADHSVLWQGNVKPEAATNVRKAQLAFTVSNLKPMLWQPNRPCLYEVSLQQYKGSKMQSELKERAGFRSFERRAGNLYLNGKPIFLKGIAINPPGRGIPDEVETSRAFALDYVRFMKSINVNIIRIPDAEEWYDVCDELGMMVFGGNYSGKVAAGAKVDNKVQVGDETDGGFPKNYDDGVDWYENDKFNAIAHHPSLMVYAMTNETPFAGKRAAEWEKFLAYAYDKLKKWDETRVYIANAGYGYGKAGDICDIHRYWGWYYSSPYTFLNIRDNSKIIPFPKSGQPVTFTECVGNYTGPDGRYNLTPAHKNPSSQLAWTGHAPEDLQARLADTHQASTLRYATELFRQLRDINPDLSGVFPFTILFYNWETVRKFDDMKPKPVTNQVKISYQPVLLSWEVWTKNLYAGSVFKPVVHIINDDENFEDIKNLKLVYELRDKAYTTVLKDSATVKDIPYYGTFKTQLQLKLPENLSTGDYQLRGKLYSNGKQVSENFFDVFIAAKPFVQQSLTSTPNVLLYDPQGKARTAFDNLKIAYQSVNSLKSIPAGKVLIIGENAADESVTANQAAIRKYIAAGGRILALKQDSVHRINLNVLLDNKLTDFTTDIDHPAYPVSSTPPRNGYYVNPERWQHPVFSGIARENLRVFSDYTDWNESQKGMPAIYPVTDGFTLENRDDLSHTAILADYSSGLQGIAIGEEFAGKGSIVLCGMDLQNRSVADPVAGRLLINLVNYTASAAGHEAHQMITAPIIWGEYETEHGVTEGYYGGMLVNATPRLPDGFSMNKKTIVVTKEGYQLAGGSRSGFNTRPGIQYVANGRRPWGPYVQTFGGQPKIVDENVAEGTGKFWCRIPDGQNTVTSLIWNPSNQPLVVKIKVNDLPEVSATIKAGDKAQIECPVNSTNVGMTYTADRRIVIMETAFSKK